jgi:predicted nucleotide-binding protein
MDCGDAMEMIERFTGPEGRRRLIEALQRQHLIEHDQALAARVADVGKLAVFAAGESLAEQGSADCHVFFLLDGEVSVSVNRRQVATRGPTDSVGEMALIDGSARRSASVHALKEVCAVKLHEPDFVSIANDFSKLWRAVAIVVSTRLRERVQFHTPPNERPVLFVGSSVEGLPVAKYIQLGLKHSMITTRLWTNGVFGPSGVTIDTLMEQVESSDFALFVFGPDDRLTSRDVDYLAPRDNVVFELGLFMGRLARNRVYLVKEASTDLKVPSDLLGISSLTFRRQPNSDLSTDLSAVCTEVGQVVAKLGVR